MAGPLCVTHLVYRVFLSILFFASHLKGSFKLAYCMTFLSNLNTTSAQLDELFYINFQLDLLFIINN
jgi:hypothetical protein